LRQEEGIVLRIYFNRDILTITFDDKELPSNLLEDIILAHKSQILMLENSIILLSSTSLVSVRESFLLEVGKIYTAKYSYNSQFFINTLRKLKSKTIKLNIIRTCKTEMSVAISHAKNHRINISLNTVKWFIEYLYELLRPYAVRISSKSLSLDIRHDKAVKNLQKIVSKKMIFGYSLKCKYHDSFFDTLSEFYMTHNFSNQYTAKTILESYTLLNCRIGAPKEVLKHKYRQLAKAYHPDRVFGMQSEHDYTVRFQHLQNAYTALKSQIF